MGVSEDNVPVLPGSEFLVGDFRVSISLLRICDWDIARCEAVMLSGSPIGRPAMAWFQNDIARAIHVIKSVRSVVKHVQYFISSPIVPHQPSVTSVTFEPQ